MTRSAQEVVEDMQEVSEPDCELRTSVLIVDDEPLALKYMKKLIKTTTFTAKSAEEATKILESESSIGVVVTDLRLPHHDGNWLAEWCSQHRPYIKMMAVTAYSERIGLRFDDVFFKPLDIGPFMRRLTDRVLEVA